MGYVPWPAEHHLQVSFSTDASSHRWAAFINKEEVIGDFFEGDDTRPIHLKEGEALLKTLLSLDERLENHRVDVFVDNQAVVAAWEREGGRCSKLNDIMKSIFDVCQKLNIDLHLEYIPSKENPADMGSRMLNLQDCKLSPGIWKIIENKFGPHTVDLMALDSNVMTDSNGNPLKHFTPYCCPSLSRVNVFAQDLSVEKNPYVYPPFCLVSAVLYFLEEQKPKTCTFVFPELSPLSPWWPKLWSYVKEYVVLIDIGDNAVILAPTKNGFRPRKLGFKLFAARLVF